MGRGNTENLAAQQGMLRRGGWIATDADAGSQNRIL